MSRVQEIDAELWRLSRGGAARQLVMGTLLNAFASRRGHLERGFSSVEAYSQELCGRSRRWVQEARCVAGRLAMLPHIRAAVLAGRLGWCVANLVARVATPADELLWLLLAQQKTVRWMREFLKEQRPRTLPAPDPDSFRMLTITVDQTDGWLFEAARSVIARVGESESINDVIEALLAESTYDLHEQRCLHHDPTPSRSALRLAKREWRAIRAHCLREAEILCEANFDVASAPLVPVIDCPDLDALRVVPLDALHERVKAAGTSIDRRELDIARLIGELCQADGWRRLGYATPGQYAKERLGISLSCFLGKHRLVRRLRLLRPLAEALDAKRITVEMALLLSGIATPETCQEWVDRVGERTIKHLREEVRAAHLAARLGSTDEPAPPSEEQMAVLGRIESHIKSGAAFLPPGAPQPNPCTPPPTTCDAAAVRLQTSAAPEAATGCSVQTSAAPEAATGCSAQTSAQADAATGCSAQTSAQADAATGCAVPAGPGRTCSAVQTSAECSLPDTEQSLKLLLEVLAPASSRTKGRVKLRLRVSEETYDWYHELEELYRRSGRRGPFLRYLCLSFIETWKHALPTGVAYEHIYARDGFRCSSPVCERREVTPHHLTFRGHGGDDSDENLTSLCYWCHIEGIHRGRIKATPPASNIRWEIGRVPHTVVVGRRKTSTTM